MPTNKDFKKLVRARSERTGESYSAARAQLLRRQPTQRATEPRVVAVTGAAGRVAYSLLFELASGGVLGPDVPVSLRLVDIDDALPALEGVVMELEDCSAPNLAGVEATSDYEAGFDGASWIVVLGAPPRQNGMERADLLAATAPSFARQGRAVATAAAADVRIVVAGNPANTNCLVAREAAPDVPDDRWTALLRLDHNRLRSQLARHLGCSLSAIANVSVWGNHSPTMVPDAWHASVDGRLVTERVDANWITNELIPAVQQRGAALIEAAGASSAASAAAAIADEIRDLANGTSRWFSPGVASSGEYGIPEGLHVGLPATAAKGEISIVDDLDVGDAQRSLLDLTVVELVDERARAYSLLARASG